MPMIGMRPPSYWKAIEATNDGDVPMLLQVTYGDQDSGHHLITETHLIPPGQSFEFPEQLYEEGGWQSVATVHDFSAACVSGQRLGDSHQFLAQPAGGVEGAHPVTLHCSGGNDIALVRA